MPLRALVSPHPARLGRVFVVAAWWIIAGPLGACSLLLDSDEVQCGADVDCARFSNAMCDRVMRLCVARNVTPSPIPTGDAGTDTSVSSADAALVIPADAGTQNADSQGTVDRTPDASETQPYTGGECPDLNADGILDCKESLVMNPDFRAGLTGWTAELNMRQAFPSMDAMGNPASGSIAVTNANQSDTAVGSTMGGSGQCIPVMGAGTFDLYVQTLVAVDGYTSSGVVLQFYPSADCSGSLNGSFMPGLADQNISGWRVLQSIITTPAATRSILLRLVVLKPFKQAPTQALFDNVLLKAR